MDRTRTYSDAIGAIVLTFGVSLMLLACGDDAAGPDDDGPPSVASVELSVTVDTLTALDETVRLEAVARDAQGNVVEDARFLWQSSDPNVATVDTAGVVTARGAGTATITASTQGLPGHARLTVEQAVDRLAFRTGPTNATAGDAIDPAVQVEVLDASGNRVEDAEIAVTLALADDPGGATLGGTRTVNAVAGVAGFSGLWLDMAATGYTLEASASGMAPDTSAAFDIGAGEAAQLAFVAQPSNTHGNILLSPAVEVAIQDAYGNTVTGATDSITLRFDRNPNDASLLGTTKVAAVGGVAAFPDLRIDLSGTGNALEAEAAGLPRAFSRTFDVTVDFVQVSAGGDHTCGITAMQQAYCWGDNTYGQLGDSTHVERHRPVPVKGGHEFTAITAGYTHTCAETADQTAYCWGSDSFGQLGLGPGTSSEVVPAAVSGTYATVTAGGSYTCALDAASGAAYCWGLGDSGQLGTNSTLPVESPTAVVGGLTFASIDAGLQHTCASADDATGQAYCWGANNAGQLGNDTTSPTLTGDSVPVAVSDTSGGLEFTDITAGQERSCGVATDDWTYCWGEQTWGATDSIAVQIPALAIDPPTTDFAQISAGELHVCAVRAVDATLYCWGESNFGQVGVGAGITTVNFPVLVDLENATDSGVDALAVSAGGAHSCAVTTDGVYCWGRNTTGQLGTGSKVDVAVPVRIKQ